jgi:precorrin-4 methylase
VTVDANSDLYLKNKHFIGTPGLWELLTIKSVNKKLVIKGDLKQYKSILNLTSALLEGYEPDALIHVSRGIKFRTVIAKLLPQTRRHGIEASLRKEWERF